MYGIFSIFCCTFIHTYVRCIYDIFSRGTTIDTVIYAVHVRFWPTLNMKQLFINVELLGYGFVMLMDHFPAQYASPLPEVRLV